MKEQEIGKIIVDVEAWADKKLDETFESEKFKALGKENDHVFQALSFLGEASQKLSIAYTILKRDPKVYKEFSEELSELQYVLHDLQSKIRKG